MDIDLAYVRAALPPRAEDGHKGTFGRLLLVAGAAGYTGAPYLAALGAVRAGCGLVFLGVPQSIWAVEAVKCASAMPFALPEEEGTIAPAALPALRERLAGCDVLALGPGLGRSAGVRTVVTALLREAACPVVLDADGLNAVAGERGALETRRGRITILTPHDGEFARLTGYEPARIASPERTALARDFAAAHGCALVLKGHPTLIALPDGALLRNTTGGSALAKGGSGDVLTGMIAALLCQGAGAAEAAACAAYLHGRAGDLCAARDTAYCVTPEDVAAALPQAFREAVG